VETGESLPLEWVDDQNWILRVPLQPGENLITLQAQDHQGGTGSIFAPVGNDSIRVTSSAQLAAPTDANLVVSELHYHPAEPSAAEIDAGYASSEDFEFLELLNVGSFPIDLTSVSIVEGVVFDFSQADIPELAPGERVVVVQNAEAIRFRYGDGLPVAGAFASGRLSNAGERLRIEGPGGTLIKEFSYGDGDEWPAAADGEGYALVLISPETNPDPDDPANWMAGSQRGGTPGRGEGAEADPLEDWMKTVFSVEQLADPEVSGPGADPDSDGIGNAGEFLWGGSPLVPDIPAAIKLDEVELDSAGGLLAVLATFRERVDRGPWRTIVQHSSDLVEWSRSDPVELSSEDDPDRPGVRRIRSRFPLPEGVGATHFLRLAAVRR
jgi:hypothetical protein